MHFHRNTVVKNKHLFQWIFIAVFSCVLFSSDVVAQQQQMKAAKKTQAAAAKKVGVIGKLFKKLSGAAKKEKAAAKKAKALLKASKDSLQVYGWHASWIPNAYQEYNYNSLTTLAYFSCEMTLKKDSVLSYFAQNWTKNSTTQLIKLAEGDDCNVLLTLKSHDTKAIQLLLEDTLLQEENIQVLFNHIDTLQKVNGVNVVFEGIPLSYQGQLTSYIAKLSAALKKEGKLLVLSLPAVDFGNKFNIKELNKYVDQFVVMGYNYYHSKSKTAGPVAPLDGGGKWGHFHLKKTVKDYLKAGLPKKKFILAMPYYGAVWRVDTLKSGKVKHKFVGHWRYNKIMRKLSKHKMEYDSIAHTISTTFKEKGKTYLCYYDNEKSLKRKYNWVKKQRLAGIGIWALGYDKGRKELWQNISKHIGVVKIPPVSHVVDTTTVDTTQTMAKDSAKIAAADSARNKIAIPPVPTFLQKYKVVFSNEKVLIVSGVTLLIFAVLGALKSLFYEQVYSKLIIYDWMTYLKVSVSFVLMFGSLLVTLKLVFKDTLLADEFSVLEGNTGQQLYNTIKWRIITVGVIVWLIIQLLSIKVFLKLNKDLP